MEIVLVILIVVAAVYLFSTEKIPPDLVAILVLATLMLVGLSPHFVPWIRPEKWITLEASISGFSNPATITIGAMFVLSAGLQKTGALRVLGSALEQAGRSPTLLMLLMMISVGAASAFINNTAAVAIFMPLVLTVCDRRGIAPSKLLIPLSYASQFGGVCTLIGTSTNLLVSSISESAGYGAFSMFEFTLMGLVMLGTGLLYVVVTEKWLLPTRPSESLTESYQLREYLAELRVLPNSGLAGKTLTSAKFGRAHNVSVVELLRGEQKIWQPMDQVVSHGDVLLLRGRVKDLMELKALWNLEIEPDFEVKDETLETSDLRLVEALVPPRSKLVGHTIVEADFRRCYGLSVLAIRTGKQTRREKLRQVRLRVGDTLLLLGPKKNIGNLRRDQDFIVLEEIEEPSLRRGRAPVALAILALVVGLAALNVLPILVSSVIGCAAMVLTRCLTLKEAYTAIDWRVIVLLAGVLPLGMVMQNSGAASLLAQFSTESVSHFGPVAVLAVLYLLTTALTAIISNSATAVLMAPLAISTAVELDVSAKPLLMAVCFAASTSFATPVGYQTNAMVYHAGGYKFGDFLKAGLPLNLIFWGLAVYFMPKIWPF